MDKITISSRRSLLEACGLVVVEEESKTVGDRLSVPQAWRHVIGDVTPTVTVDANAVDLAVQVDHHWNELAALYSVVDAAGDFLISVSGPGAWELGWARVRTSGRAELAQHLAGHLRSAEPEFVTADVNGRVVLGVTAEEYDVWLILCQVHGLHDS